MGGFETELPGLAAAKLSRTAFMLLNDVLGTGTRKAYRSLAADYPGISGQSKKIGVVRYFIETPEVKIAVDTARVPAAGYRGKTFAGSMRSFLPLPRGSYHGIG